MALHRVRKRINDYERETGTSEWEYYKKIVNPYELVYTQKKYQNFPESVCLLHPLSRSYFKMIEILGLTEFFKPVKPHQKLRSAHVCEGPGGFIEALLNLCTKNSWTLDSALAMTLRPSKANIPGWKRAYHFLRKAPMVQIEYGADDTGDIMSPANQTAFLEKTRSRCHIFTADGGFDFSEHYGTQEEEVFPFQEEVHPFLVVLEYYSFLEEGEVPRFLVVEVFPFQVVLEYCLFQEVVGVHQFQVVEELDFQEAEKDCPFQVT
jgi:hypothetical protein